jgi:hypothetical protein
MMWINVESFTVPPISKYKMDMETNFEQNFSYLFTDHIPSYNNSTAAHQMMNSQGRMHRLIERLELLPSEKMMNEGLKTNHVNCMDGNFDITA